MVAELWHATWTLRNSDYFITDIALLLALLTNQSFNTHLTNQGGFFAADFSKRACQRRGV